MARRCHVGAENCGAAERALDLGERSSTLYRRPPRRKAVAILTTERVAPS
jgi:hypothetical protein